MTNFFEELKRFIEMHQYGDTDGLIFNFDGAIIPYHIAEMIYSRMDSVDMWEKEMAEMHRLTVEEIRAEAITEFSKRMEKALTAQVNASSNEMLAAFMWCLDLVKNVEKQLKGATDGKSDL